MALVVKMRNGNGVRFADTAANAAKWLLRERGNFTIPEVQQVVFSESGILLPISSIRYAIRYHLDVIQRGAWYYRRET